MNRTEEEELANNGGHAEQAEANNLPANNQQIVNNQMSIELGTDSDSTTVVSSNNLSLGATLVKTEDIKKADSDSTKKSDPIIDTVSMSEEPMEEGGASIGNVEVDNDNIIGVTDGKEPEVDPYAYLSREEYSSERFKIKVSGLPTHYACSELKRLFNNKLHLNSRKIKPLPKGGCAYVSFASEEDRTKAIKGINGHLWKRQILKAELAKPTQDPLVVRRSQQKQFGSKGCSDGNELLKIGEVIMKATAPWSNILYEVQLDRKMIAVTDLVNSLCRDISKVNHQIKLKSPYPIQRIQAAPIQKGYRNKCEFTIGINPETKEKTVGFRAASYKMGSTSIGPIDGLPHIPQIMIDVVNDFQNFIRLPSEPERDTYDPETHKGLWKQLTVRVSQSGEVLVLLIVNGEVEDYENLKGAIKSYYNKDSKLVSTFLIKTAEAAGKTERNKPEIVFGSGCITEEIMGLKFRVSAEAFFQVNTPAAEVLYESIKSVVGIDSKTTVLDVCCGTGTIGLCLAKDCSQVIGIEMNEEAVYDAKENAALNGLQSKCRFHAGRAEDVLETIFAMTSFDKVVAVVDPPRPGLHKRVIQSLRRCKKFDKIVYVSCDPKAAMMNFVDLCRPISKTYKGMPFIPTQFIPVDLFPDSPKFELVVVFERIKDNQSSVKVE